MANHIHRITRENLPVLTEANAMRSEKVECFELHLRNQSGGEGANMGPARGCSAQAASRMRVEASSHENGLLYRGCRHRYVWRSIHAAERMIRVYRMILPRRVAAGMRRVASQPHSRGACGSAAAATHFFHATEFKLPDMESVLFPVSPPEKLPNEEIP